MVLAMSRALCVTQWGDRSVLQVRSREIRALGPGQVRVQVHASGVNFIDVYKRLGIYRVDPPFVLGEEGSGVVSAVGPRVEEFRVGDRVAWVNVSGSAAEEVLLPVESVVHVPDGVALDLACAAMVQGLTAHALARSVWPVRAGGVALVHAAAGGVGQLLVQLLVAAGVRVVATAGSGQKLAIATRLGAWKTVNYAEFEGDPEGLATRLRDVAGGGVDVVFDGVGRATFEASLASLRPRGLLALYGAASGQVEPFDPQLLNQLGSLYLTRPSLAAYLRDRDELLWRAGEIFEALESGSLRLQVGGRYGIDDAVAAYELLESRRSVGKLLFVLSGSEEGVG